MQSSTSTQLLMVRICEASVLREGEVLRKDVLVAVSFMLQLCVLQLGCKIEFLSCRRRCDDTVLNATEWEGKEIWKVW